MGHVAEVWRGATHLWIFLQAYRAGHARKVHDFPKA
jgi:hypothetical protein